MVRYAERDEQCLCIGEPAATRRILFLPPLFGEMNRVRRTWVQTMRLLAAQGIACALPDLPGCNESTAPITDQSLHNWRGAITGFASDFGATHIFSVRGGCLIDDGPRVPVMRLAPINGALLLKAMVRARIAGDKEAGLITSSEHLAAAVQQAPVQLAGHAINAQLWQDLTDAEPAILDDKSREVALGDGISALWLRAEPQYDAACAHALANAIDGWSPL